MKCSSKLTLTMAGTLLSTAIIAPVSFAETTGKVTVDTLRVREEPSTSGDIIGSLDEGESVNVIEEVDDWYKIRLNSGAEAYVSAKYVKLEGSLTTNEGIENSQDTLEQDEFKEMTEGDEIKLRKDTTLHSLPAYFSTGLSKLSEGTSVTFIERINNWVCIEYNKVRGWVYSRDSVLSVTSSNVVTQEEQTETQEEQESEEKTPIKTGYVSVSSAYVREEGRTGSEIITSFSLNNEVSILSEKDNWYEIQLKNGTIGWIYKPLVSDEKTEVTSRGSYNRTEQVSSIEYKADDDDEEEDYDDSESYDGASDDYNEDDEYYEEEYEEESEEYYSDTGMEVVDLAKQYKGCAYVYGGSGSYSFDCSGFTMYIFDKFGISLPHNARTQSYYGEYVSRNDLQPGDLLIFNDRANSSIGHCGIYIGDGLFIHAENPSNGVTITSIWSSYYSARYVMARRLV